ncbi:hypothetical protein HPP92_004655 [Vanilla planifolia]|uniref:Uncharacterized protein n=1 Tax=Vanilla planifolia TaxID=51239 RepID=A0A835VA88_VANPL|nr:hypothetical protein HPP92_004655 [Vanilla planifolia]
MSCTTSESSIQNCSSNCCHNLYNSIKNSGTKAHRRTKHTAEEGDRLVEERYHLIEAVDSREMRDRGELKGSPVVVGVKEDSALEVMEDGRCRDDLVKLWTGFVLPQAILVHGPTAARAGCLAGVENEGF